MQLRKPWTAWRAVVSAALLFASKINERVYKVLVCIGGIATSRSFIIPDPSRMVLSCFSRASFFSCKNMWPLSHAAAQAGEARMMVLLQPPAIGWAAAPCIVPHLKDISQLSLERTPHRYVLCSWTYWIHSYPRPGHITWTNKKPTRTQIESWCRPKFAGEQHQNNLIKRGRNSWDNMNVLST